MMRFFLALVFFLSSFNAFAASGAQKEDKEISARLISGLTAVGDRDVIPLGLEIKLARGWHTYWRSPGQAGLPPQIDWSRSQTEENNLKSATLLYPFPARYNSYGLETIGYGERVVFPVDVIPLHKGKALTVDMDADLLLCASICLPKHLTLTLTVPEGPAEKSEEAGVIEQARARLPSYSGESGILLKSMESHGKALLFAISARDRIDHPDIFIENDKDIGFGVPEVDVDSSGFEAVLTVRPVDNLPEGENLTGLPVTLTITNGGLATEIKTRTPNSEADVINFSAEKPAFGAILLLALLGGIILNLMPCVLPVLSLKVVGLAELSGESRERVRKSYLATAGGVLFSFLILALSIVVLKGFGIIVGWGVQFQQPLFLMFLIVLLTFFAANLWGFFDVSLPRFLADRMEGSYRAHLVGDFISGAFATLLATPCSAPFLGTAVGFALAAGPLEILAVFMCLGFGLASPYFLVAAFPSAAGFLPKPGLWMVRLRQVMGVALILAALWLIGVLSLQVRVAGAFAFGQMMLVVLLLLALRKRGVSLKLIVPGLAIVVSSAVVLGLSGSGVLDSKTIEHRWLQYNPATLRADIAEGKTVFLNVTADWCLTCKANREFALSNSKVSMRLFHGSVVAMQADWTNPDPVVSELLHKHGRFGVPFNVVYGPLAPEGIVLPELLTPSIVLRALDRASGWK